MKYIKNIKEFFEFKPTKNDFNDAKSLETDLERFCGRISDSIKSVKDEDFEKIKTILESDCQEFINELVESKCDKLIFRGIRGDVGENIEVDGLYIKSSRNNRRPLDMYHETSDLFDEIFTEYIGVPLRRAGIFTTKNPIIAGGYSSYKYPLPFIFFPIGDYKYYWNPDIQDLYSHVEHEIWYYTDEYMLEDEWRTKYENPLVYQFSAAMGKFLLNGEEVPHKFKDEMVDYICNNHQKYGLKPNGNGCYVNSNDEVIICDNSRPSGISNLKWIPEIEVDDYIRRGLENINREQGVRDIVNGYTDKGIEHVILQEITFVADKFYLIDAKYYFKIKEWLESKTNL